MTATETAAGSGGGAGLSRRGRLAFVAVLMLTQTFGWGTGLSLLGVLGQPIAADLGMTPGMIFAAAIVLYGSAAIVAPTAGRMADRLGGAVLLGPGAAGGALSLFLLSQAQGPVLYFAAWVVHGLAFHFMLLTAAYTAITQIWGAEARRVIGILTLATGLCSTVMWPVTQILQHQFDWREICLIFAGFTLLVVLPLNLVLARATRGMRPATVAEKGQPAPAPAPLVGKERLVFVTLALLFGLSAGIGNSVGILIIDLYAGMGLDRGQAVYAGSLVGIAFLIARAAEIAFGNRIHPVRMSLFVFGALPLPFVALLGWLLTGETLPPWLALATALAYGAPQGLAGLMRPALVQHLFGTRFFGTMLGRLSRVGDVASAATPPILAGILATSPTIALCLITGMALTCLILVLTLCRLAGGSIQKEA